MAATLGATREKKKTPARASARELPAATAMDLACSSGALFGESEDRGEGLLSLCPLVRLAARECACALAVARALRGVEEVKNCRW